MTHEIDVDQLEELLTLGAQLVDVREAVEYAGGHVPGARWIPMGQLSARLPDLDGSRPVHLICASGNRSGAMCDLVRSAGHEAVNVRGGTTAWARAGKPLDVGGPR